MDTSSLIKLPAELRNRIYEYVLYQPQAVKVHIFTGTPTRIRKASDRERILALTAVCKQLCHECSPIFYEINKFRLIAKKAGESYNDPYIYSEENTRWQRGLCKWLEDIGAWNVTNLSHVSISIGTTFMTKYEPSSESIWRSVASVMKLFNTDRTQIIMWTDINWTYNCYRAFTIGIPLTDPKAAREAVNKVLDEQKKDLVPWCQRKRAGARRTDYMQVELGTCAQELMSFVNLLEVMSNDGKY